MKVQKHCIYNLDFSYTRITPDQNEIDFRGVLSYHIKSLEQVKEATRGFLEQENVNIFLFFQVQRHIDLVLNDIKKDEILTQRPIIINRLQLILRKELVDIGLELVDFRRISLWSHGAADRGVQI
ncbi:MAG: SPFH domain-containing protein [Candidatus Thorarchaeota archaeon]